MPFDDSIPRRTPAVLRALLGGLPDEAWRADEGPGTWSPFDVLGHLIHGEATDWIPRARRILDHGESVPFDPFDRFAQLRESEGKTPEQLLAAFEARRSRSLAALAAMKEVRGLEAHDGAWTIEHERLAGRAEPTGGYEDGLKRCGLIEAVEPGMELQLQIAELEKGAAPDGVEIVERPVVDQVEVIAAQLA